MQGNRRTHHQSLLLGKTRFPSLKFKNTPFAIYDDNDLVVDANDDDDGDNNLVVDHNDNDDNDNDLVVDDNDNDDDNDLVVDEGEGDEDLEQKRSKVAKIK